MSNSRKSLANYNVRSMFIVSDLKKLANWEPIVEGFGCEGSLYNRLLVPLFEKLKEHADEAIIIEDGNSSNYGSIFVHKNQRAIGEVEGIYVFVSLLGPYAAVCRKTAYLTPGAKGYSMVEPHELLRPSDAVSPFEESVFRVLAVHELICLTSTEVSDSLPECIAPYGFCLNKRPWNKVLHVLFSNTD